MSTTYTGNITFTNGTTITIDTDYLNNLSYSTNTYNINYTPPNIIIDNTTVWPSTTITWPTSIPSQPITPLPLDGYFDFSKFIPQKKETKILVDELKSSIFADLDKCIEALKENKELDQNYTELVAKAEMMHEMLAVASEMIKERVEKLKVQKEKVLSDNG